MDPSARPAEAARDGRAVRHEADGSPPHPPGSEPLVVSAFTRGLDLFRLVAVVYAALLAWTYREDMVRPWVAVAIVVVLGVWSIALLFTRRRPAPLVVTEIVLASVTILATLLVYPREVVLDGIPTVPGVWAAACVVAAAIAWGARGGLAAAVVISVVDLVEVMRPNATTFHNIILLFLLGGLIGLAVTLARESQARLEAAVAAEERLAERERISRVVHDGVLQALALINRRGREIGGETVVLADLAAREEMELRRLVGRGLAATQEPGATDLAAVLAQFSGPLVTVSAPGEPVLLPSTAAAELRSVVAEALDNVRHHAGAGARAWVLLESVPEEVVITIRDDGDGMAAERLAEAAAEGRLGVAQSIRGRVRDLGGTVSVVSAPGAGCTLSVTVPRTGAAA
jgi:signal transduction histidine kinase